MTVDVKQLPWSRCRAFRAARQEGFDAALASEGVEACPYPKARSRGTKELVDLMVRHAWQAGWTAGWAEVERRKRNPGRR